MVTERFAARARYSHALTKSLLVGALAFGAALFYQLEQFASREHAHLRKFVHHETVRVGNCPLSSTTSPSRFSIAA